MTEKEKEDALLKAGRDIKKILPNFHGYVQYNLMPERKKAMLTKHETVIDSKP